MAKRGPKGPSKWTVEVLDKVADELVSWFKGNQSNWYLKQFAIEYDYIADEFDTWAQRSEKFRLALKKAKQIQETRLVQLSLAKKVDTTMAIFALKNVAGWRDKQPDEENKNQNIIINVVHAKISGHPDGVLQGQRAQMAAVDQGE